MSADEKFTLFLRIMLYSTIGMVITNGFDLIDIPIWVMFIPLIIVIVVIHNEMRP